MTVTDNKSEWFLKDHVTLKTGEMADENSVINCILSTSKWKTVILNCNNICVPGAQKQS